MNNIKWFKVRTNGEKLEIVSKLTHEAFQGNQRLMILVPTLEAANYIDTFLWKNPTESFLPHAIADSTTNEQIAICISPKANYNQAECLLNLTPGIAPGHLNCREIWEIFDLTTPEKEAISRQKMAGYKS